MDTNIPEEETLEDSSRKRSGDCLEEALPPSLEEALPPCLEEALPPSLMAKCDPYFCGVCNQEFRSQIISNAHYAGTPHEKNIHWEMVKMGFRSPQNPSPPKRAKKLIHYSCDVCNIFLSSVEALNKHKLGNPHKKKLEITKLKRDVCNVFLNSDDAPIHQKQLQLLKQNTPSFSCDLCEIITNSLEDFEAHLQGKSHQKKAKQLSSKSHSCDMCGIVASDMAGLEMHFQGKPHKKKARLLSNTTNNKKIQITKQSSEVKCDVCDIVMGGSEDIINQHKLGRPHLKKLEELENPTKESMEWFNQYDKPLPSILVEKCTPLFCGVCLVHSTSEIISKTHYAGKPHEKKVMKELEKIFNGSGEIAPKRKNQSVKDLPSSLVHKLEKSHQKIAKQTNKTTNTNRISCDVCNIFVSSEDTLNSHKLGKAHQKKLKMMPKTLKTMPQVVPDISNVAESIIENKETEGIGNVGLPEVEKEGTPEMKKSHSEEKFMSMIDDKTETEIGMITDSQGISDLSMEQGEISKNTQIDTNLAFKSLEKEEGAVLPENCEVKKSSKDDVDFDDALNSDDDLIILECQDSFPSRNDQSINDTPVIESVKLCEYPVGKKDKVNVSTQDYATLEHDTFLNDIIIDFYLLYLVNNVLPIEDRQNVHIFSTMFYKRLLQAPRKGAKKVPEYETDDSLTPAEKRHFRVASWTKTVDLFEKDMLIVPICECSHWFLIIVVKPGLIFVPAKKAEKTNKGESFVIVLDSVGGTKNYAVKNVRRYLACEWNKKKCSGERSLKDLSSSAAQMRTLRPNKPEQQNNSDCGIYLLHYVEKVFENVSAFLWKSLVTYRTREWFTIEEVGRKRGEIAQLIKDLAAQQRPGEVIEYPAIKFTAESSEEGNQLGSEETEAELEGSIISGENEAEIGMNTWK